MQTGIVSVNPARESPLQIVMMSNGERVCWPAHDVAGTLDGVWLWVSDMVGIGWTALRDGDAIILHPVDKVSSPQHMGRRA